MEFLNNTSFNNGGYGYSLSEHRKTFVLKNNLAVQDRTEFNTYTVQSNNMWRNVALTNFQSTDISLLESPRLADGSLPVINFMQPSQGSILIDAGVNVGLPYKGAYPDIGYIEF